LNIENSVIVDNHKIGIAINNSQATILNSLIGNNDSLFVQNGGGLFAGNNSTVDVRNTILFGNNTGISSVNSTVDINFNDLFGNNVALNGAGLGISNISENPLMVFMFNQFGASGEVEGFHHLKLAAGSHLVDKGDPSITNGTTASRSDIGLFGNLALPRALASAPDISISIQDSFLTLMWQNIQPEEKGLFSGTMIYRDSIGDFQPDTSNQIKFIVAGITTFKDSDIAFGKDLFYRTAFVDTNGAVNAYSPEMASRIDFTEISVSSSDLSIQLDQGDTLIQAVTVANTGTLPLTVVPKGSLPDWLQISPTEQNIPRGANAVFNVKFSAGNLQKDSLYASTFRLSTVEDTTIDLSVAVKMLVNQRDFVGIKISTQNLDIQIGQGDTLLRPIVVTNSGTVSATIEIVGKLPAWLQVIPKSHILESNEKAAFLIRFNGQDLVRDSLYNESLKFTALQDTSVFANIDIQMRVLYRDVTAPRTVLFKSYPDTVQQANLSFSYSAIDTFLNDTTGTPLSLIRYVYRFSKIVDALPIDIKTDTTSERRLDF